MCFSPKLPNSCMSRIDILNKLRLLKMQLYIYIKLRHKKIKSIWIRKEVKLAPFANHIIVYIKKPNEYITKQNKNK